MPYMPTILALDFDGVLCDGMLEYFQTTWRTYCQIWSMPTATPPLDLEPSFARLRPVIETGWEMPVLIRARLAGISENEILQDWQRVAQDIVRAEGLNPAELAARIDETRDRWITRDLSGWLSLHRFYPGVVEKLKQVMASSVQTYIVTTKEGRFVRQLLQQEGVEVSENFIFGKEVKRPKHETLRQLLASDRGQEVLWFVEDRLKTLQSVMAQPDLVGVGLYLAAWGYNTQSDRDSTANNPAIKLLELSDFSQDFSAWSYSGSQISVIKEM